MIEMPSIIDVVLDCIRNLTRKELELYTAFLAVQVSLARDIIGENMLVAAFVEFSKDAGLNEGRQEMIHTIVEKLVNQRRVDVESN